MLHPRRGRQGREEQAALQKPIRLAEQALAPQMMLEAPERQTTLLQTAAPAGPALHLRMVALEELTLPQPAAYLRKVAPAGLPMPGRPAAPVRFGSTALWLAQAALRLAREPALRRRRARPARGERRRERERCLKMRGGDSCR